MATGFMRASVDDLLLAVEQRFGPGYSYEDAVREYTCARTICTRPGADLSVMPDPSEVLTLSPGVPPRAAAAAGADAPAGAGRAAGATEPTAAQPQFADDDPDSPYYIESSLPQVVMLDIICELKLTALQHRHWEAAYVHVPAAPATPEEAAELQIQTDQLVAQGRMLEAFLWQCQIALYAFTVLGTEHSETVAAVYSLVHNLYQRGRNNPWFVEWVLPRAAKAFGLADPRTRQAVEWGAAILCDCADPREQGVLTRATTNVAKHLPGGLGWGQASLAPVDEDQYARTCVMQHKASELVQKKQHHKLARQMFERCLAYYESVGPHWLCSARAARTRHQMGLCVTMLDGFGAVDGLLVEAKKAAVRELGPTHRMSLSSHWMHAEYLAGLGRYEQALSLYTKTLRLDKEALGVYHKSTLHTQVSAVS